MTQYNYEDIKSSIKELVSEASYLSSAKVAEIEEYVDHNEYGMALESLVYAILEEKHSLSNRHRDTIKRLADKMNILHDINI